MRGPSMVVWGAVTVLVADPGWDDGRGRIALMWRLLRGLPVAVAYVAGPDLVFECANEEYRRVAGGRGLIGRPLREALPDLGLARLEMVQSVARSGRPCQGRESEVWVRRPGREPEQLFVDFVHQPVRDDAGGVAGVLICVNDVTAHVRDRHRLEVLAQRLEVTEERYRTLFETLPHGIIHYSVDGTILGANRAAGQILGLVPEAMTTWPLDRERRGIHEDGSPFAEDEFPVVVAMRTGRVVRDVVAGLPHGRTGEMQWLRVTAVPDARDEQGRPQRAYAMITDITGQRRAEDSARKSNRLLGRLRDANVLGVLVASEDGTVQEANDAFLDILGYSHEDLESGRIAWRALTPPEWAARDEQAVEELRRTGACMPYEKEYLHRDGHRVPVLIGSAAVGWQPLRGAAFVLDLTTRQRREEIKARRDQQALRAINDELEQRVSRRTSELTAAQAQRRALEAELQQAERLQTVGQLTSGIAHDFGNLLAVIIGYAERAEDVAGDGGDGDRELHRMLAEIHSAAEKAVHLSGDLLRFAGRARAKPEPIDLDVLIAGIKDLLAACMSGRADIRCEPSPVPPPAVLADRGQLEQVLLNLAVNARDAMPEGGTLTISTSLAEPFGKHARQGPRPCRYAQLTVQDTGIGMTAEVREKIFERFFTTKPEGTGTGLGLSTVHGIITAAGGTIEVDSREGHGTTFRIYLPATSTTHPPSDRAAR